MAALAQLTSVSWCKADWSPVGAEGIRWSKKSIENANLTVRSTWNILASTIDLKFVDAPPWRHLAGIEKIATC